MKDLRPVQTIARSGNIVSSDNDNLVKKIWQSSEQTIFFWQWCLTMHCQTIVRQPSDNEIATYLTIVWTGNICLTMMTGNALSDHCQIPSWQWNCQIAGNRVNTLYWSLSDILNCQLHCQIVLCAKFIHLTIWQYCQLFIIKKCF